MAEDRMDRIERNLERATQEWNAWREEHQKEVQRLDNALNALLDGQVEIQKALVGQDKRMEYMERAMDRLASITIASDLL